MFEVDNDGRLIRTRTLNFLEWLKEWGVAIGTGVSMGTFLSLY